MTVEWEKVVVDAADPVALGRWWAEALDWSVTFAEPDECEIRPAAGQRPYLTFLTVPEGKGVKNRLHLDFRPADRTRDEEVEHFVALGAKRIDVGQYQEEDPTFVVLADPEGNEFCVLNNRPS